LLHEQTNEYPCMICRSVTVKRGNFGQPDNFGQ